MTPSNLCCVPASVEFVGPMTPQFSNLDPHHSPFLNQVPQHSQFSNPGLFYYCMYSKAHLNGFKISNHEVPDLRGNVKQ